MSAYWRQVFGITAFCPRKVGCGNLRSARSLFESGAVVCCVALSHGTVKASNRHHAKKNGLEAVRCCGQLGFTTKAGPLTEDWPADTDSPAKMEMTHDTSASSCNVVAIGFQTSASSRRKISLSTLDRSLLNRYPCVSNCFRCSGFSMRSLITNRLIMPRAFLA